MRSKIILDSVRLLEEELLTLSQACKHFPVRCSRSAMERWLRRGSRGVVLESVLIAGRRYTTRQAIERFIRSQLQTEPERSTPIRGTLSKFFCKPGLVIRFTHSCFHFFNLVPIRPYPSSVASDSSPDPNGEPDHFPTSKQSVKEINPEYTLGTINTDVVGGYIWGVDSVEVSL